MITKNGEGHVALVDAERLDDSSSLERERIHLLLIDDARRGLEDIAAGRTHEADAAIAALQQHRARASRRKRGTSSACMSRMADVRMPYDNAGAQLGEKP